MASQHQVIQPATSWHQMLEDPFTPLEPQLDISCTNQPQSVTIKVIPKRIKELLLKIQKRTKRIKNLAARFLKRDDPYADIEVKTPERMYEYVHTDQIKVEALMDFCTNGWLDSTFLHWWLMHLYTLSEARGGNIFAFLDPSKISEAIIKEDSDYIDSYIYDVFNRHFEKEVSFLPYMQSGHWTLFNVCPITKKGYIVDSFRNTKEPDSYLLTNTILRGFGLMIYIGQWLIVTNKNTIGNVDIT